jgi:2-iminobutanoate/2-iminopropanoate deaminase
MTLMNSHKVIKTEFAPAAVGPYSQAVCAGNMVFVSGQLGMDPKTGQLVDGGIEFQTQQALENVKSILSAEALTLENVVQVQVFLADIKDFAAMNEIYARYFTLPYPSRAAFQVAALPIGGLVEIMAMAVK